MNDVTQAAPSDVLPVHVSQCLVDLTPEDSAPLAQLLGILSIFWRIVGKAHAALISEGISSLPVWEEGVAEGYFQKTHKLKKIYKLHLLKNQMCMLV